MIKHRWILWLFVLALCLTGCTASPSVPSEPAAAKTDEVRAVWVPYMEMRTLLESGDAATVRAAIAALMQDCADRGVNTVYLHVRAHSDAYYDSAVFTPHPLAAALLSQGLDPLTCAVEEGHARGLAVHAWINPYRIGTDRSFARCDDVFCDRDRWYYVPTSATAQALIVDGVREIVDRYAVDGVQFDDYFYPEGAVETTVPAAFEADFDPSGDLSLADWRRDAVNHLIRAVYEVCHRRDGCVFGVSPSYDSARNREQMYADTALWAREAGYVDYLCPQLYVGFAHQYAPFEEELAVWTALERDPSVSLLAGLALYKTGIPDDAYAGDGATEWANGGDVIARQLLAVRAAGWDGAALYSHLSFIASDDRDGAVTAAETQAVDAVWNAERIL